MIASMIGAAVRLARESIWMVGDTVPAVSLLAPGCTERGMLTRRDVPDERAPCPIASYRSPPARRFFHVLSGMCVIGVSVISCGGRSSLSAESSAVDNSESNCEIICEHRGQMVARCFPDGVPSYTIWAHSGSDCVSYCLAVMEPDCVALQVADIACLAANIDAVVEQCGMGVCEDEKTRWVTCVLAACVDAGQCAPNP